MLYRFCVLLSCVVDQGHCFIVASLCCVYKYHLVPFFFAPNLSPMSSCVIEEGSTAPEFHQLTKLWTTGYDLTSTGYA